MASKLVWTSDPEEAKRLRESGKLETRKDLAKRNDMEPSKQLIRVGLDKKRRAGKTVTVALGFQHSEETLAQLAQALKKKCGSGGTAKEGDIEIQGDHVEKVKAELVRLGYRVK